MPKNIAEFAHYVGRGGEPISTNRIMKQKTGGRLSQLAPNDFQKTLSEDRRKPTTVTTVTARKHILIKITIDQPMYGAPLVDLVAMGGVSGVVQLLDGFDITLVQVAHDGVRYTINDNFVKAIQCRTIRVIDDSWPENARARAARMAEKFPEFTIDLSVPQ